MVVDELEGHEENRAMARTEEAFGPAAVLQTITLRMEMRFCMILP